MKLSIRIILIILAAFISAASVLTPSFAQKRLGAFSHNTRAHRDGKYSNCDACHTIPTKNWTAARADKHEPFPDVANFPYHTSCFGCHTRDIYSNGGAFCGTCHVVPTMRASGGRGVLAFPIKSHSRQFTTIFPHDVHQNLIALNLIKLDVAVAHFVPASFGPNVPDDATEFNNCAICHKSSSQMPKVTARVPALLQPLAPATADTFAPKPEFFKDAPNSHASCFTCHYQNVKPGAKDCAGCHSLSAPYAVSNVVPRYSLKFNHQDKDHANKDCTTCHVRITQNSDVRKMKDADVAFQTCSTSSCHGSNLTEEIGKREASINAKQSVFQCTYCHTPAIGRYPVPSSHRIR